MTDDTRAVPEGIPELRSVVELRRTLKEAGAPEAAAKLKSALAGLVK